MGRPSGPLHSALTGQWSKGPHGRWGQVRVQGTSPPSCSEPGKKKCFPGGIIGGTTPVQIHFSGLCKKQINVDGNQLITGGSSWADPHMLLVVDSRLLRWQAHSLFLGPEEAVNAAEPRVAQTTVYSPLQPGAEATLLLGYSS